MHPLSVSFRFVRFAVVAMLAAAVLSLAPATAFAQAQFYAIGDLPGGSLSSQVRDATKHNGTISAVGAGNGQTPGCTGPCQAGVSLRPWVGCDGNPEAHGRHLERV